MQSLLASLRIIVLAQTPSLLVQTDLARVEVRQFLLQNSRRQLPSLPDMLRLRQKHLATCNATQGSPKYQLEIASENRYCCRHRSIKQTNHRAKFYSSYQTRRESDTRLLRWWRARLAPQLCRFVPIWRAEADEGWNEINPVVIGCGGSEPRYVLGRIRQTQKFAAPLHGCARDGNISFQRVCHFISSPSDCGGQSLLRNHRRGRRRHQ